MKMSMFDRIAEKIMSCRFTHNLFSEKVKKELRLLYPTKETEQICHSYYRDKISLIIKIWLVGLIVLFIVYMVQISETVLSEGNVLNREDVHSRLLSLKVFDEMNHVAEIEYEVRAQAYSKEEIDVLTEKFIGEYESLICGENKSLEEVQTDLLLKETYDTYPMEFIWESSDYRLIGEDGAVANEELTTMQMVLLTVRIVYEEEEQVYSFTVQVVPPHLTEEEKWQKEILAALAAEDEKQKYETKFRLPSAIGGKKVSYEEKEENANGILFLLLPFVSILLFLAKDRDLTKEIDMRKKKMNMKYPEFVSKFQLLLGTGMTVRNIFFRLSRDKALGKELEEEIELLVRDMKNGIAIKDAMDRFGKRTGNPLYIKFSALLVQNMKKGTDDLTKQLSKEAAEAFVLRKTNAKKMGEEVGTKLLGPMILMLGVVMAILMIPAFLSFQF